MTLIVKGKTKDVYRIDDKTVRLHFKDDVTGKDGVFDPGENEVGLQIEGVGNLGLRVSSYFFDMVEDIITTHRISVNLSENTMDVYYCKPLGMGLEVIARLKAGGSFIRRYGAYVEQGADLDGFVEFTLKDDQRNDPPISETGLLALGIVTQDEIDYLKDVTLKLTRRIEENLKLKGLVLHDIKYEFGYANAQLVLMDEISAGSMRVSLDDSFVDPITLSRMILSK